MSSASQCGVAAREQLLCARIPLREFPQIFAQFSQLPAIPVQRQHFMLLLSFLLLFLFLFFGEMNVKNE